MMGPMTSPAPNASVPGLLGRTVSWTTNDGRRCTGTVTRTATSYGVAIAFVRVSSGWNSVTDDGDRTVVQVERLTVETSLADHIRDLIARGTHADREALSQLAAGLRLEELNALPADVVAKLDRMVIA